MLRQVLAPRGPASATASVLRTLPLAAPSRPNSTSAPSAQLPRQYFPAEPLSFDELTRLARHRGFVYPSSEIYRGVRGQFDYGPVGALLKKNIADAWWKRFIRSRADVVPVDTAIIQHPQTWEVAGHVESFTDPQVTCKGCGALHRADKPIEEAGMSITTPIAQIEEWKAEVASKLVQSRFKCTSCGGKDFTEPIQANLLMSTRAGSQEVFLRPETAQGIFASFDRIRTASNLPLPFGVGQVGKAFRNEISPRDLLFRMREFEQLELEYFCPPSDSPATYDAWVSRCHRFLLDLGLRPSSLRLNAYTEGLAHYALATTDIEYKFPFGWGELWGIANRGDYDLRRHKTGATALADDARKVTGGTPKAEGSPKKSKGKGKGKEGDDASTDASTAAAADDAVYPHTVEPSVGLDRLFLSILSDGWRVETVTRPHAGSTATSQRTVLALHHALAPYRAAVVPARTDAGVRAAAKQLHARLAKGASVALDMGGTLGKRYARQDEIGTPYVITVDEQTVTDGTVTVRDRDTTSQIRVHPDQVDEVLRRGDAFVVPPPEYAQPLWVPEGEEYDHV